MLYIFYELGFIGRRHARRLGADVGRVYFTCGVLTLSIWLLYPICWGLSEGGNVISPDSEAVFYGVLDLIAKPVFSAALLYGHWGIDPGRLGLKIREAGHEDDHMNTEKRHTPEAAAQGTTTGAAPMHSATTGADHVNATAP
jgi:bacteriorhodopsin